MLTPTERKAELREAIQDGILEMMSQAVGNEAGGFRIQQGYVNKFIDDIEKIVSDRMALSTAEQSGSEPTNPIIYGEESYKALIAEASELAPDTKQLCFEAMGLILKLFPPDEYGEDSDVANLYETIEIIKHRHGAEQSGSVSDEEIQAEAERRFPEEHSTEPFIDAVLVARTESNRKNWIDCATWLRSKLGRQGAGWISVEEAAKIMEHWRINIQHIKDRAELHAAEYDDPMKEHFADIALSLRLLLNSRALKLLNSPT